MDESQQNPLREDWMTEHDCPMGRNRSAQQKIYLPVHTGSTSLISVG
jgi:hypothetical protein